MSRPVQVMVVDDSAVVRGLLVSALSNDPGINVVATAMHGEAALKQLRGQSIDVVLLDVEMPVMDGLTALPRILAEYPDVRVVMVSSLTQSGAASTVRALALGAAGCIAKPATGSIAQAMEQLTAELVPLVKALGRPEERRTEPTPQAPRAPVVRSPAARHIAPQVIVIGSSTGGPNALSTLFKDLSPDVSQPILIVQHMPATFTTMLAKHLEKDSGRPCQEAVSGGVVERGRIYVAPGDFHMVVEAKDRGEKVVRLTKTPPENFCRPSVDPMLRSLAQIYGARVLTLILTGMGHDGLNGGRAVVNGGGTMVAQDEATSVVWGMPGAVATAGLCSAVLALDEIAPGIAKLAARAAR